MRTLFLFFSLLVTGQLLFAQFPDSTALRNFDSWPIEYRHKKKKLPKVIFGNLLMLDVKDDEEWINSASVDTSGIFGDTRQSRSARLIFMSFLYHRTDTFYIKAELMNQVADTGKTPMIKMILGEYDKDDLKETNFCSKALIVSTKTKSTWEYQLYNDPHFKQLECLTNGKDTIHITRTSEKKLQTAVFMENNNTIAACRFSKDPVALISRKTDEERRKMISAMIAIMVAATDF